MCSPAQVAEMRVLITAGEICRASVVKTARHEVRAAGRAPSSIWIVEAPYREHTAPQNASAKLNSRPCTCAAPFSRPSWAPTGRGDDDEGPIQANQE